MALWRGWLMAVCAVRWPQLPPEQIPTTNEESSTSVSHTSLSPPLCSLLSITAGPGISSGFEVKHSLIRWKNHKQLYAMKAVAEYGKPLSEYQWSWFVFLCSSSSGHLFLRVSDLLHFPVQFLLVSYQFFIFMYTKLYYISITIICHFLNFSSVFPRTTKDVFSFWKVARKEKGKQRPMPPGKLLHPCYKSFQTHHRKRG